MKVLVIDDSPVYRRVLERAVRELGHECLVASDGDEGWELFRRDGADAVISNWLMPAMDGDELCRLVRGSERPYAYFIFCTARDAPRNRMDGMEAGADDYLAKPLDENELAACLVAAARVTGLHRRLAEQQRELEQLNGRLYEQSRHDPLTGLRNRLCLGEDIAALEERAGRERLGYSVVLCDVDRFKAYNDECGHLAGDRVLEQVAGALAGACRQGDAVYRFGGEEMLMLLPEAAATVAVEAAERMRSAVEALRIPHPVAEAGSLTVSVGVAVRAGDLEGNPDEVLKRADEALYRAKAGGRNRIESSLAAEN